MELEEILDVPHGWIEAEIEVRAHGARCGTRLGVVGAGPPADR